ncbi:MAG: acetate kinase [Oscillochloris sp.]|nr:acetate kinase [Oscillochloris sp.]
MILTINCGSSSVKYQLYTADTTHVLAKGMVARIGEPGSSIEHSAHGQKLFFELPVPNHHAAIAIAIQYLLHPEHGAIENVNTITAVGHRAVHGGDTFVDSTIVTEEVIQELEECTALAPLHNPPNLAGIEAARNLLPGVPHVVVFDTAFHQSMPPRSYVYALPYNFYEQHKIRRYGFHGTSVRYVIGRAAESLGRPLEDLRFVVCHLGNGVTMAAVDGGRSIDTSIGFATFSGVMMGTRSGDIDPGLIFYLHRNLGFSLDQIEHILYKESGLLGVSGVSNDMRVVLEHAEAGNQRCQLAVDIFTTMVRKYIGSYTATMGGIDALIFTAGIGENSPEIRARVCQGLEFLGIKLDMQKNVEHTKETRQISTPEAKTAVLVVPTDEERMIALDTLRLIQNFSRYPR